MTISPSILYTDTIATATVAANDPDGDPLSYTFDWYVDDGNGAQLVQSKITHCWILLRYKMSERKFALECTLLFRSSLQDSLQKHI